MEEIEKELFIGVKFAVTNWLHRQRSRPSSAFFLWYAPARYDGEVGQIMIAENKPGKSWELATGERISPAWTKEKATAFCLETIRKCPVLSQGAVPNPAPASRQQSLF